MKKYQIDPDCGLTWEEKLERRIKEACDKQHQAEIRKAKAIKDLKESELEVVRLNKEFGSPE